MIYFDSSALTDFKAHKFRGIGRYVKNFKQAAERLGLDIMFFPFSQITLLDSIIRFLPKGKDLSRNHLCYPLNAYLRTKPDDVVVIPSQTDVPFFFPRRYVLIVHDLIPWKLASMYGCEKNPTRYKVARFFEKNGITNAEHIIAVSDGTKHDLINILGVPHERISVLYQGLDEVFLLNALEYRPAQSQRKRFLYYGGSDARKNIGLIFELARLFPGVDFLLILDDLTDIAPTENLKIIPSCEDSALVQHILESDALIFPSLAEGFGLPVFEVSALGRPVLASNIEPYRSVFKDSIFLFDPDISSAKSCLQRFLDSSSEELASRVSKAQEIARSFTWERTVREFMQIIKGLRNLKNRNSVDV
ncbi:MAG: glycosyltransferase family 1 protein [Thermoplasmatales archaeon]